MFKSEFFIRKFRFSTAESVIRKIIALIPFRWRNLTSDFWKFTHELDSFRNKHPESVINFQTRELKSLLNKAYNSSPFYREFYSNQGFHPDMFNSMDDISKIPILSRDNLRDNSKDMIIPGSIVSTIGSTSGTTGNPLKIAYSKSCEMYEWATICWTWAHAGFSPEDGRIEFRGYLPDNIDYYHRPDQLLTRLNIVTMSPSNIDRIVNAINKSRYRFWHGYPSAICKFLKTVSTNQVYRLPSAVFLGSEQIYPWQIDLIRHMLPGVDIISWYGQAERCAFALNINTDRYQFLPRYGIVEHDNINSNIVATSLINDIQPIIRYRIADSIHDFNPGSCNKTPGLFPECKDIIGRIEDMLKRPDGTLIPPAVLTFPLKNLTRITKCQIRQINAIDYEFIFVASEDYTEELNNALSEFTNILGNGANIVSKLVDDIPTDRSGKYRWIEYRAKTE